MKTHRTQTKSSILQAGLCAATFTRTTHTRSLHELVDPYEALDGKLLSVRKPCVIIGQIQRLNK